MFTEELFEKYCYSNTPEYLPHIKFFQTYLDTKINNSQKEQILISGISTNNILSSIDFFIKEKNITSISRAESYATALRSYFLFLFENNIIQNTEFKLELLSRGSDHNSYIFKTTKYIKSLKILSENRSFNPYSAEEIDMLLKKINHVLKESKNFIIENKIINKENYNELCICLGIKLVYMYGFKYSILRSITVDDIDFKYNHLKVNGFNLLISPSLVDDLKSYVDIKKTLNHKNLNLFCYYDGKSLSDKTYFFSEFLNKHIARHDFNGLIQYSIIKMLEYGVDSYIIANVTGSGNGINSVISKCQKEHFEKNKSSYFNGRMIQHLEY